MGMNVAQLIVDDFQQLKEEQQGSSGAVEQHIIVEETVKSEI